MASYGVPLTTLTEREAPGGGRMLTGRLGDAVVIGLPIDPGGSGAPRWKLTVVQPTRTGLGSAPQGVRMAERARLAERAARPARADQVG